MKLSNAHPFVDITSIGLRRGKINKTPSQMLSHPSDVNKSNRKKGCGMLLMGCEFLSSIENPIQETYNTVLCIAYSSYTDFLESNFDGTQNSFSPLAQIYLTGKVDNKVYTFKEMMKQPDREHFETAMYKEVKSIFDNDVWIKVTRASMLLFYEQILKSGKDIKRRQL